MALFLGALAIRPQRVVAAVHGLLGYIPGVGLVERNTPIRVLAEPASLTQKGVTVRVTQAILTDDQTQIIYQVFGVPCSAYPESEAISGCTTNAILRLPDGAELEITQNMPPVPSSVNKATFILPCIWNTLPGSVPENWELPISFVPAPADLNVMPVIEITPSVQFTSEPEVETSEQKSASQVTATSTPPAALVNVEQVIETQDGYILIVSVQAHIPEGSWLQVTGPITLQDAAGKTISYAIPTDMQPENDAGLGQGGVAWAVQFKGAGVTFPLVIRYSGVVISQVDPQASTKITFNAGPDPQPDQVWALNQEVQLAGHTLRLVSVTAHADGYSFRIDPGSDLSGVSVQIEGYQATGGGGGAWRGEFNTSLVFAELPKGSLTIRLSNPLSASATQTWQAQWQPETLRTFEPTADLSGVCLNADTFQAWAPLPAGLDGSLLITELNPELQLVLASVDGSQQDALAPGDSRGTLAPGGTRLAYPSNQGIILMDIASRSSAAITNEPGYDIHWSPDGTQLAYVRTGEQPGIWVIAADGSGPRRLSDLGFEVIAGWSPDGNQLYYAAPDTGGNGWQFQVVDVNNGKVETLFTLENASRKAPMPALSPDGKWIAYRAIDNSSLYLIRTDGTGSRLVLDQPATAISGFAWEQQDHRLAISLLPPDHPEGVVVLLQIDTCEAYILPGLHGVVDEILIP